MTDLVTLGKTDVLKTVMRRMLPLRSAASVVQVRYPRVAIRSGKPLCVANERYVAALFLNFTESRAAEKRTREIGVPFPALFERYDDPSVPVQNMGGVFGLNDTRKFLLRESKIAGQPAFKLNGSSSLILSNCLFGYMHQFQLRYYKIDLGYAIAIPKYADADWVLEELDALVAWSFEALRPIQIADAT